MLLNGGAIPASFYPVDLTEAMHVLLNINGFHGQLLTSHGRVQGGYYGLTTPSRQEFMGL